MRPPAYAGLGGPAALAGARQCSWCEVWLILSTHTSTVAKLPLTCQRHGPDIVNCLGGTPSTTGVVKLAWSTTT